MLVTVSPSECLDILIERISVFQKPPIMYTRETLTSRLIARIDATKLRIVTMSLHTGLRHIQLLHDVLLKEVELWTAEHAIDTAWASSILPQVWLQ